MRLIAICISVHDENVADAFSSPSFLKQTRQAILTCSFNWRKSKILKKELH